MKKLSSIIEIFKEFFLLFFMLFYKWKDDYFSIENKLKRYIQFLEDNNIARKSSYVVTKNNKIYYYNIETKQEDNTETPEEFFQNK